MRTAWIIILAIGVTRCTSEAMFRLNSTFSIYKLTSFCLHLNFGELMLCLKKLFLTLISFLWGLIQLLLFVCSLCDYLWYPSVLKGSFYDTAFNIAARAQWERGHDFSLALSVVDWCGKLYQAYTTLWLLKTMALDWLSTLSWFGIRFLIDALIILWLSPEIKLGAGMIRLPVIQEYRLDSGCMIFQMQWMGIGHLSEVFNFYASILLEAFKS